MSKETSAPPVNHREWLSNVRDLLGDTYLKGLFGISVRTLQRWVAKWPHVGEDSVRKNFIDRIEELLRRLGNEPGGIDYARAIVSRFAHLVGCEIRVKETVTPDKATIEEECLDDYPAVMKLHEAVRAERELPVVEDCGDAARLEIEETLALYREKKRGRE